MEVPEVKGKFESLRQKALQEEFTVQVNAAQYCRISFGLDNVLADYLHSKHRPLYPGDPPNLDLKVEKEDDLDDHSGTDGTLEKFMEWMEYHTKLAMY